MDQASQKLRVRFAPSPTGPLHIGGARSALFNYLLAKRCGGDFVVRMEDTDRERSTPESEENIKDSLHWLGIDWNEGVDIGGPYAPYRQMDRLQTYQEAAQKLIAAGQAYYCYCSEAELAAQREQQVNSGETPRYTGVCRDLLPQEREAKEKAGIKPVIRFCVPEHVELAIDDLVRGHVSFSSDEIGGDFIIMKSEGIPTYNFAVVVDDYLMQISHIIRGEEHLSNTPRQLLLIDALGYPRPVYGHVSLILGQDHSKMSKRHGSVSVTNYRAEGYLPQALVNFLALLGWSPECEEEILSMAELESQFSLERVSKSPAVFDANKLRWLNGRYLRALPIEEIAEAIRPYLSEEWNEARRLELATMLANHLEIFSDVQQFLPLIEGEDIPGLDEETADIMQQEHVPQLLAVFKDRIASLEDFSAENIKAAIKAAGKELGVKGAGLFMPLRIALTGSQHGPDLDKLAALIGKERVLLRLEKAVGQ